MNASEFSMLIIIIAAMFGLSQFFCHISCVIARVTKKKVCRCWDCPKKCELYERSEPEVSLDYDNLTYYFCGYCNHSICRTSDKNNNIKKFHTYCGHCGNKVNWSQLDEREWYMENDRKSFGTRKTIGMFNKFKRKVKSDD